MRVVDRDEKLRVRDPRAGAFDADRFDRIVSFADAGRIGEPQKNAAGRNVARQSIARCAGNIGDDGGILAREQIVKRAFARVRAPADHGDDALDDGASRSVRRLQLLEPQSGVGGAPAQFVGRNIGKILVRIIDDDGGARDQTCQQIRDLGDRGRKRRGRRVYLSARFSVDEIADGLGLGKRQLSRGERAARKFTRLRLTRARRQDRGKHIFGQKRAAVAADLDSILARI